MLACDGTHIGVSVRNINLHNGGITAVDDPTRRVPGKHKRYDCAIISDRKARERTFEVHVHKSPQEVETRRNPSSRNGTSCKHSPNASSTKQI